METLHSCDFISVATRYANAGLRVFPIVPWDNSKEPIGKRPAIKYWQYQATKNPAKIEKWAKKFPDHNVGICTTGLLVIDVDGQTGIESLQKLEEQYDKLPCTMRTVSSHDPTHYHLIFRGPSSADVRNSQGRLGPKLDVRGMSGQVLAPGSIHKTGKPYIEDIGPDAIKDAPAWLVALCKTTPRLSTPTPTDIPEPETYRLEALTQQMIDRFPASRGCRHDPMVRMVASLCCKTLTEQQIIDIGTRWLRAYEGQYGLSFEDSLAALHICVEQTRESKTFKPHHPNPDDIEIPVEILHVIHKLADSDDDIVFLKVVMKEWFLDGKKTNTITHTHPTLDVCVLMLLSLTVTNKQLSDGYKQQTGGGLDDHKLMDFKRKYFSTEKGFKATEKELFIRQQCGTPGKPSVYRPSEFLLQVIKETKNDANATGHSGRDERDGYQPAQESLVEQGGEEGGSVVPGKVLQEPSKNSGRRLRKRVSSIRLQTGRESSCPGGDHKNAGGGVPQEGRPGTLDAAEPPGRLRSVDAGYSTGGFLETHKWSEFTASLLVP